VFDAGTPMMASAASVEIDRQRSYAERWYSTPSPLKILSRSVLFWLWNFTPKGYQPRAKGKGHAESVPAALVQHRQDSIDPNGVTAISFGNSTPCLNPLFRSTFTWFSVRAIAIHICAMFQFVKGYMTTSAESAAV
jgi:hypothetical protein